MNKSIIWVNGDCLSPQNPALQEYPNTPAIWVWDDALIEEWQLSLKRITFIYECLLELPVEIRRGNVAEEVIKFAQENNANLVVTTDSPSPKFNQICDQIEKKLELELFEVYPFFDYDGFIDLKRFSRYWKVAQKYVFD
ncbi:MAG: deoxyribodipyrimidine photo-lyase [Sphaerospermopsis sp. SIO1G2]|nr:deoxyribodipyrimidine photo-lyase [Sphaerospermopsis sp. SIO1G1]NET71858.1 deoxyribodipyrimidine photo-lyase [Sphaerospermopsis sp. SIO1G2]